MNIEFFRNYLKIVECGTISAASRELHVAQSALSNQICQLEKEYGAQLFVRTARKMELTDVGSIVYRKAKSILALYNESLVEVENNISGKKGTVRLGLTQIVPDVKITDFFLMFRQNYPEINFEFYEANSSNLINMLKSRVVEICFVRMPKYVPPELEIQMQVEQRICGFCGYKNPWITPYDKTIKLSSLNNVPLAISRGLEDLLVEIFARENIQPTFMSVSTSRNIPFMWAKAGKAIALICTDGTETTDDAESFCRPLTSDNSEVVSQLKTTKATITLKGRTLSSAAKIFMDFAKKESFVAL